MSDPTTPYRVLARAYRPKRLSELVGQDALVRTLTNAMASGRIAHAFLLCGIRGVGKTTTARIIAKGLNCVGPDGAGGPTPEPCGVCGPCVSIQEERSLDVIEMDAASHTGKDDVLELIEGVRYGPTATRYKVYVVDEVHMLSEKAFNALLKTIEEPPPHAKFVFATTEARKVPVTVLSRCQRFDLRRVEPEVLEGHLGRICGKEGVQAEPEALALIARAAEGSVRDSLSLLDQAIAMGEGRVEAATVALMLGLGDRTALLDLFDRIMAGDAGKALDLFADLWAKGAEPVAVVQDLLEIAHWLACLKLDRAAPSAFAARPELLARGRGMAERLGHATLGRAWQVLLKGLDEARLAPDARAAAEMVLLRLATMADLPPPGEIARLLREGKGFGGSPAPAPPAPKPAFAQMAPVGRASESMAPVGRVLETVPAGRGMAGAERAVAPEAAPREAPRGVAVPKDFRGLVGLLAANGQPMLAAQLAQGARLIAYQPGRLELRLEPGLPGDLPTRLNDALFRLFDRRWMVAIGRGEGEPTLNAQDRLENERVKADLARDPQFKAILDAFPGATIAEVRRRSGRT